MTQTYVGNIDRLGGVATERSSGAGEYRRPLTLPASLSHRFSSSRTLKCDWDPGRFLLTNGLQPPAGGSSTPYCALFVGMVLLGMIVAWKSGTRRNPGSNVSIQTLASYGQQLFLTIVTIELSLVLLVAPAATAGAICLDKARGTLDHVLATDLSNAEIVLGKLGVRLIPVLGLVVCLLPLSALTSLLGGIDPVALFGSFLTAVACAVLGCSLAMALSVWGRKTHEVLMVTYLLLIAWLCSPLLVILLAFTLGGPTPRSVPRSSLNGSK